MYTNRILCCQCKIAYEHSLMEYNEGNPYCPLCSLKYYLKPSVIDIRPDCSDSVPVITVNKTKPVRCRYHNHRIKNASVKALFFHYGETKPQMIDMSFCPQCNRLYIFQNTLWEYEKQYGTLLVERQYSDIEKRNDPSSWEYAQNTILNRWGYRAQADKQSEQERRTILICMMQYNPDYKEEIKYILNTFITNRSNCVKALPLWKSDLMFVCSFNIGQKQIDITDWQRRFQNRS